MIAAKNFFNAGSSSSKLEFSDEEKVKIEHVRKIWNAILRIEIEEETDFFACGAGSMDVVRLVEEIKDLIQLELQNEDVFMNTSFGDFISCAITKIRGESGDQQISYSACELEVNKMNVKFPTQLFINGQFVDSDSGKTLTIINPANEKEICKVQSASVNDVDRAVSAAKCAFEEGEWSKISARERGKLLYK